MDPAVADQVTLLAQRLQAVVDPALRVAYVRHQMLQMTAGDIAEVMIVVTAAAEARQPAHTDLLLALCRSEEHTSELQSQR